MTEPLPLIRGEIVEVDAYRSTRGGDSHEPPPLPERTPSAHGPALVRRLDELAATVQARDVAARDPEASREILVVRPEAGSELNADALADKRGDARLVTVDPDTGSAIVDVADPEMQHLRRKARDYADPEKKTPRGRPRHERALAPIAEIDFAGVDDLSGPRMRAQELTESDVRWFEVSCRGGIRLPQEETDKSRGEITRVLASLGHEPPEEFVATERAIFFVRLSMANLRALAEQVDCVYEIDLAPPPVRDLLLLENPPVAELEEFQLEPPEADAPSVVLLDTGIATRHPLLAAVILSAESATPTSPSGEDTQGHGTNMAGVALYPDLGASVEEGGAKAYHWLQSSKILEAEEQGSASEENRHLWPAITERGIELAEDENEQRRRVFAMAVTADHAEGAGPLDATSWSASIDQMAFNSRRGRLIIVSAGNADLTNSLLEGYPDLNLVAPIHDPAQSANALTVGAYTVRHRLPTGSEYSGATLVGTPTGISPWTTSSGPSGLIKPDVVMEGGNVARSGSLFLSDVPTLATLTTRKDFLISPLGTHSGTSCATANAARFAAALWRTVPWLRPESLRGLVVHSASWTETMRQQFPAIADRLAVCGYGVPDFSWASECLRDRATVVIEDTMPNLVVTRVPKARPPTRRGARDYDEQKKRQVKFFKLPVPEEELLAQGQQEVELRVTLSYFAEPTRAGRRAARGLDLQWDMQGPQETEEEFRKRINRLARAESDRGRKWAGSFPWQIGKMRRGRGTVSSDRWTGPASFLAGSKLLAVYPVLGWWDRRDQLRTEEMPFSLMITVRATGVDVYTPINVGVTAQIET